MLVSVASRSVVRGWRQAAKAVAHHNSSVSLLRNSRFAVGSSQIAFSSRFFSEHHHHHEDHFVAAVRSPAPNFKATAVVDGKFKEISLKDYAGKWLVLFFYPLDFTFVCPTEIIAFNDRAAEFAKLGVELAAVSVDSEFSHLAWTKTPRDAGGLGKMTIPLIADITKVISSDYGVLLPDEGIALRGLFIIDPKQIVRQITINDLPTGRSVDETLRLIKAIQFTEKHGEVCPADWQPGQDTMKGDPEGSKSYFKKVKNNN